MVMLSIVKSCMAAAIIAPLVVISEMIGGWAHAQPVPGPAEQPPPGRIAIIRSRGELAVCIWPEYFAITYRNPRNSELEGIDMARALAANSTRWWAVIPRHRGQRFHGMMGTDSTGSWAPC